MLSSTSRPGCPSASWPAPRAWARLLGPALPPCSLAPQGLRLSEPLEASLSAFLPLWAAPGSLSDAPAGCLALAVGAGGEPAVWELQALPSLGPLSLRRWGPAVPPGPGEPARPWAKSLAERPAEDAEWKQMWPDCVWPGASGALRPERMLGCWSRRGLDSE